MLPMLRVSPDTFTNHQGLTVSTQGLFASTSIRPYTLLGAVEGDLLTEEENLQRSKVVRRNSRRAGSGRNGTEYVLDNEVILESNKSSTRQRPYIISPINENGDIAERYVHCQVLYANEPSEIIQDGQLFRQRANTCIVANYDDEKMYLMSTTHIDDGERGLLCYGPNYKRVKYKTTCSDSNPFYYIHNGNTIRVYQDEYVVVVTGHDETPVFESMNKKRKNVVQRNVRMDDADFEAAKSLVTLRPETSVHSCPYNSCPLKGELL